MWCVLVVCVSGVCENVRVCESVLCVSSVCAWCVCENVR